MGVIFDEVVGQVESDSPPPAEEKQENAAFKAASLEKARQALRRLDERAARLAAD
jgi:hypothetical protein